MPEALSAGRFASFCAFVCGLIVSLPASAQTDTHYEYDALGRLVVVERDSAGKTVTYSYDAAGNRTAVVQAMTPAAIFSVNDVSVVEGGVLSFTVSKADGGGQTYAVNYATANGSAGAGDYTGKSGTLNFGPTETTKPFPRRRPKTPCSRPPRR